MNNDVTNLYFYYYNFNLNGDINEPKEIKLNDMNIQNKMVRCQINSNSTFIICFYYSILNVESYLTSTIFNIQKMNLIKANTSNIMNTNEINQIKLAMSYNDKFFVCFLNDTNPICLINNYLYEFKEIECSRVGSFNPKYKVIYFKETDDFILLSRKTLFTTILNNADNSIKKCFQKPFKPQSNENSIIL